METQLNVGAAAVAVDSPTKHFISFTLDLCGSTKAKQAFVTIAGTDEAYLHTLYAQYGRWLCAMENRLYEAIDADSALDLARLFQVKAIGDEFWYFYEVPAGDEHELKKAAVALLSALAGVVIYTFPALIPSRPLTDAEERLDPTALPDVTWTTVNLYVKACVDLVRDGLEINAIRYERVEPRLRHLVDRKGGELCDKADRCADLLTKLNIGVASSSGTNVLSTIRTDFIGFEIDRFFRIAKYCLPQTVLLGDALRAAVGAELTDLPVPFHEQPVKVLSMKRPLGSLANWRREAYRGVERKFGPDDLKGVDDPYSTVFLIGLHGMSAELIMPDAKVDEILKPTRDFMSDSGYLKLPASLRW